MSEPKVIARVFTSKDFLDGLIRFAFIALLIIFCYRIFAPFVNLVIWGLVLAVTIYPIHQACARRMGGKQGLAASLIVLIAVLLLGIPTIALSISLIEHSSAIYESVKAGTLVMPAANPKVAQWPVVGERLFTVWNEMATNIDGFMAKNSDAIQNLVRKSLGYLGSTAAMVLFFVGSFIVAGVMMAYGESGSAAMQRVINRIAGPSSGPQVHTLSVKTTRSVAVGVLGVAFIQALILGVGFMFAGVPGAGILALITLIIGILQLPALLISLPVLGYLWGMSDATTTSNIIWTIYLLVGGASDNVLKPLLLGRGVDAPMAVILLGALGGMVSAGFIGLFLGAVILAVGYQVFMKWVDDPDTSAPATKSSES